MTTTKSQQGFWKSLKSSLGIIRRRPNVSIQVGIDFGTSSTKIAYAQLGVPARIARPLLFDHGLPTYAEYCLPSVAAYDKHAGRLLLGSEAARHLAKQPWGAGLRRFKVLVAGKYERAFQDEAAVVSYQRYLADHQLDLAACDPEGLTAVFLAFAMQQSLEQLREIFKGSELSVAFNICIPIDHIQNSAVYQGFRRILSTAEVLTDYLAPGDRQYWPLLERARDELTTSSRKGIEEERRVFAIPESVAQVVCYLVSLKKRPGIHAVLDFGAGTTDVSIFNLDIPRREQPTTWWYAARNIPRGTAHLELMVADYLGERNEGLTGGEDDQVVRILSRVDGRAPAGDEGVLHTRIVKELQNLRTKTNPVWVEGYRHLARQSDWMKEKVHVFVAGGGAGIPYVRHEFSQSWANWGPYSLGPLPEPDDYDSLGGRAPFQRLSVAYGLTRPRPELGDHTLPPDSPNHTPPRPVKPQTDRSALDEVYPTEGWFGSRRRRR